ncbi:MAG: AAA family ATPase [Desulfobacteraceae bacterium]|nr:AAA family ATPase [Desulfobacteraceae bacterium]
MHKQNFIVMTGGPGSGKTTVIEELKLRGFTCAKEIGRKIIKEQVAQAGKALPWKEIFTNDIERKQDFTKAVATYEIMVKAYTDNCYKLIKVPFGSVTERVTFILTTVKQLINL